VLQVVVPFLPGVSERIARRQTVVVHSCIPS
jgi:hypothetical protein